MKVVELRPAKPKVVEGIVDLLRKLLEQAEAGDLQSLFVVGQNGTGTGVAFAAAKGPSASYFVAIGALEHLKQKLIQEQLDWDER